MNDFWAILDSDEFYGFIRHTLTTVGGGVFVQGHFDPTQWQTFTGAAVAILGVLLSIADKRNAKAKAPEVAKSA